MEVTSIEIIQQDFNIEDNNDEEEEDLEEKLDYKVVDYEGRKLLQCNKCTYKTERQKLLHLHNDAVHRGVKRFKCDMCSHKSNNKQVTIIKIIITN